MRNHYQNLTFVTSVAMLAIIVLLGVHTIQNVTCVIYTDLDQNLLILIDVVRSEI